MYKTAVIGDKDSIVGFSSIGMDIFSVSDKTSASSTLKGLVQKEYAVVFITESTASLIKEQIEKFKDEPIPAIILIPGMSGNTGEGMSSVSKNIERAVGSHII